MYDVIAIISIMKYCKKLKNKDISSSSIIHSLNPLEINENYKIYKVLNSNSKENIFKCIQSFLHIYNTIIIKKYNRNNSTLNSIISQISNTRYILKLFNSFISLRYLNVFYNKYHKMKYNSWIYNIKIYNLFFYFFLDILTDLSFLTKYNILSKEYNDYINCLSSRIWFITSFLDIITTLKKLTEFQGVIWILEDQYKQDISKIKIYNVLIKKKLIKTVLLFKFICDFSSSTLLISKYNNTNIYNTLCFMSGFSNLIYTWNN